MANYGGFETFVAGLGPRLVRRGFEVYCSQRAGDAAASPSAFHGMRLLSFPLRFPRSSKLGRVFEILYDCYFVLKCAFGLRCQTVYCLGVVSGFILPVARLFGVRTIVNVDGIEWRRQKFRSLERGFLRLSFHACGVFADNIIIDNGELLRYLPARYRRKAAFIPYGVSEIDCGDHAGLPVSTRAGMGPSPLSPRDYWLVVARLEPENSIEMMVDGYLGSRSKLPLVVVGGFSDPSYERQVRGKVGSSEADMRVRLMGPVFDQRELAALRCNCRAYIHGHTVGGTNPSLLEAMSAGNVIAAHDNAFNREVCGDAATYFDSAVRLRDILDAIEKDPASFQELAARAKRRASENYRWEDVTERYVGLLTANE